MTIKTESGFITVLSGDDVRNMKSPEVEEKIECHHVCISNCRRNGCNCEHGEWHE